MKGRHPETAWCILTTIKAPDNSSGIRTTQRVKINITQKGKTIVSN